MKETRNIALLALVIITVVVILIIIIFLLSGHKAILTQFLTSTVEGNLYGMVFTTGGPFGMWIIAFLLLRFTGQKISLGSIRLYLTFPEPQENVPPTRNLEFCESKCFYSVFNNGDRVIKDKLVEVQIDNDVNAPYIYVNASKFENPEFQVSLNYNNQEWISDSFSPKTGSVELQ